MNIELQKMVEGEIQKRFDKAFKRVIYNLQDLSTSYKPTREITIKMKFTQNENRDDVTCTISVTEKLSEQSPAKTFFAVNRDTDGYLYAEEYGAQVPGQMGFDVDKETGEVHTSLRVVN